MFKIKMDEAAKKRVSEALHIQESDEYEMVLCDEAAMMEEGKNQSAFFAGSAATAEQVLSIYIIW